MNKNTLYGMLFLCLIYFRKNMDMETNFKLILLCIVFYIIYQLNKESDIIEGFHDLGGGEYVYFTTGSVSIEHEDGEGWWSLEDFELAPDFVKMIKAKILDLQDQEAGRPVGTHLVWEQQSEGRALWKLYGAEEMDNPELFEYRVMAYQKLSEPAASSVKWHSLPPTERSAEVASDHLLWTTSRLEDIRNDQDGTSGIRSARPGGGGVEAELNPNRRPNDPIFMLLEITYNDTTLTILDGNVWINSSSDVSGQEDWTLKPDGSGYSLDVGRWTSEQIQKHLPRVDPWPDAPVDETDDPVGDTQDGCDSDPAPVPGGSWSVSQDPTTTATLNCDTEHTINNGQDNPILCDPVNGWQAHNLSCDANCVLGAPPTAEDCTDECSPVVQETRTVAVGVGQCNPHTHHCMPGDGDCLALPAPSVEVTGCDPGQYLNNTNPPAVCSPCRPQALCGYRGEGASRRKLDLNRCISIDGKQEFLACNPKGQPFRPDERGRVAAYTGYVDQDGRVYEGRPDDNCMLGPSPGKEDCDSGCEAKQRQGYEPGKRGWPLTCSSPQLQYPCKSGDGDCSSPSPPPVLSSENRLAKGGGVGVHCLDHNADHTGDTSDLLQCMGGDGICGIEPWWCALYHTFHSDAIHGESSHEDIHGHCSSLLYKGSVSNPTHKKGSILQKIILNIGENKGEDISTYEDLDSGVVPSWLVTLLGSEQNIFMNNSSPPEIKANTKLCNQFNLLYNSDCLRTDQDHTSLIENIKGHCDDLLSDYSDDRWRTSPPLSSPAQTWLNQFDYDCQLEDGAASFLGQSIPLGLPQDGTYLIQPDRTGNNMYSKSSPSESYPLSGTCSSPYHGGYTLSCDNTLTGNPVFKITNNCISPVSHPAQIKPAHIASAPQIPPASGSGPSQPSLFELCGKDSLPGISHGEWHQSWLDEDNYSATLHCNTGYQSVYQGIPFSSPITCSSPDGWGNMAKEINCSPSPIDGPRAGLVAATTVDPAHAAISDEHRDNDASQNQPKCSPPPGVPDGRWQYAEDGTYYLQCSPHHLPSPYSLSCDDRPWPASPSCSQKAHTCSNEVCDWLENDRASLSYLIKTKDKDNPSCPTGGADCCCEYSLGYIVLWAVLAVLAVVGVVVAAKSAIRLIKKIKEGKESKRGAREEQQKLDAYHDFVKEGIGGSTPTAAQQPIAREI